jgi:mono/diheme cytochrome c family protein
MRLKIWFPLLLLFPSAAALVAPDFAEAGPDASAAYFETHVRPLLEQRCEGCHSSRTPAPQGGLRLDSRLGWERGGVSGPAVVPGKPEESLLIRAVRYTGTVRMPPAAKLPQEEIDILVRWVELGAPDPRRVPADTELAAAAVAAPPAGDHWALQPIRRPEPPRVRDRRWARAPLDRFILARLEQEGLKPSPPADRRTLIRRVYFDLTGLPPTPEAVEAFVRDRRPDAYERVVDALLASPQYGERWGRHWLDVARYADTHGYDKDKRRDRAWPYRDYVIRSFNEGKPYSRFIREQLAADVLYPDDPEAVVATGFIAAGPWDFVGHLELFEGSVEKEKTRVLDRDEMVAATMGTFTSLTVHCARCHDHKFDPISQKEYYQLQAVFAGVERGDREYGDPALARRRGELAGRRGELQGRIRDLRGKANALQHPDLARIDRELEALRIELTGPLAAATTSPTNGYHSGIESSPDVTKWVQVDLGRPVRLDEIRLVPARPVDFPDTPGFGFPRRYRVEAATAADFSDARVLADHSGADVPNPGDTPVKIAAGEAPIRYLRVTALRLWPRTNDYVFALAEVQALEGLVNRARGAQVTALDSIEAGRWSTAHLVNGYDSRKPLPDGTGDTTRAAEVQGRIAELEKARVERAESLLDTADVQSLRAAERDLKEVEGLLAALPAPNLVYAVQPRKPRTIRLLARGEVEQVREEVAPGALACVSELEPEFHLDDPEAEGLRRAALAAWIADPKNPLTWRSIVNRVWHYHFGQGIVDTPNDFGRNGSEPTHPELLDWLAGWFLENGESIKALNRMIVLSATYRQSASANAAAERIDAGNRLLWRQNRRRLDAESLRDTILAVSGKLDPTVGGQPFELFRFKDDHSPIYDFGDLETIENSSVWRRTVYHFTVRSVPNPFLDTLDCADPNLSTPVRNTTLTALQALALLNNPFVLQQAEFLAARLTAASADPEAQVRHAYRLCFGREPTPEERRAVAEYAGRHGLVNACRLLFNASEFVFID